MPIRNEIFDTIPTNKVLSKDEFLKLFRKIKKINDLNEIYLSILCKLEKSVIDDDTKTFDAVSKIIEYIQLSETTENLAKCSECFASEDNPFLKSNLVVKACRNNKLIILRYLINCKILNKLSMWIRGKAIALEDKDEMSHNAFYYAIRSRNVDLVETLISFWSQADFSTHVNDLEGIISSCYQELKLRQVPLSSEIESYVVDKLLNYRCHTTASEEFQNEDNSNKIKNRLNFVVENINLLVSEYKISNKEIDMRFLLIGKTIVLNIHVLKRLLKFSYAKFPWEEIEFCLYAFIISNTKNIELNIFYRAILDKEKILFYLEKFSPKLKGLVFEDLTISCIGTLPKVKRENVVDEIIKLNPEFQELYSDYKVLRDIHSLDKINTYIGYVSSCNPQKREGQLIMMRAIQVLGEHLKNTLESPKLSMTASELLLLSVPKATRKIMTGLRNSLSHSASLSMRIEMEENANDTFFKGIQTDLIKIGNAVNNLLFGEKVKIIIMLLTKIVDSANVDEINVTLRALDGIELDQILETLPSSNDLKQLIEKFSDIISNKTAYEKLLFDEMNALVVMHNKNDSNYLMRVMTLKSLNDSFKWFVTDDNTFRGLKFQAKQVLNLETETSHQKIVKLATKIFNSAYRRMPNVELMKLMLELYHSNELQTHNLKWLEELKAELSKKFFTDLNSVKPSSVKNKFTIHLQQRISELKSFLAKHNLCKSFFQNLPSCLVNKNLLIITESLVLDILTILEMPKSFYNDIFCLDLKVPVLFGKSLRNHLAHYNILCELSITEPNISVFLSAKLLVSESFDYMSSQTKINNHNRSKYTFKKDLRIVLNQQNTFISLEKGDLNSIKSLVSKGADLEGMNTKSWTALHLASKSSNLNAIKYLFTYSNISSKSEDEKGQTPLHVAATYGSKDIVQFLVKEKKMHVNAVDKQLTTPLHLASIYGHSKTVSTLLCFKANVAANDIPRNTPLLYALRNKHFDVVKLLLKEDACNDVDNLAGSFTCLYLAAEGGSLDIVSYLLKKEHDINAKTDRGVIPLHVASLNGHLDVVTLLISKGAEINAQGIDGCTPLHYAVENGHRDIAYSLVRNGANVNAFDKTYHNTPLHYAAKDGYKEIVDMLLENKANPKAKTTEGITALHFSSEAGHLEIATALLKSGSDVNSKNIINCTPLHLAAENGHKDIVNLLVANNALVNVSDLNGFKPLHKAVSKNQLHVVQLLVTNNAEINALSKNGMAPLHIASERNYINIIKCLIAKKAFINISNYQGLTPLHLAADAGLTSTVDILLKNRADVNDKDDAGNTPLHFAARSGHESVIELLLRNNANSKVKTSGGHSPLHSAVIGNHESCVIILLTNGGDVNAKDDSHKTLLFYAASNNNEDMVKIIISQGNLINDDIFFVLSAATTFGFRSIVDMLLKKIKNVNEVMISDSPLLHLAAKRGHNGIVKSLLNHGADVNEVTTNNVTALYYAAEAGHEQIVETLIDSKANVEIKTEDGITPLFIASTFGHFKVVDLLVKYGANINTKDNKNRTAIEMAVAHGHIDVVKTLIATGHINVNMRSNDGFSLLHIASQENRLDVLKYLVEKGCDLHAKNNCGSKAVHFAAREGNMNVVKFFIGAGISINDLGMCKQTLLHYASMSGKLEIVEFLIEKGANLNVKDDNGITPLHIASGYSFASVVKILIRNGAYYNVAEDLGNTPSDLAEEPNVLKIFDSVKKLFEAVKNNLTSEVEKYIQEGAIINCKNDRNAAPLHFAAWKGFIEIVETLLRYKCDPNILGEKGFTPLHYACKFSNVAVVEALLCNGAKYDIPSKSNKIPLNLAEDMNIINLLTLVHDAFYMIKKNNTKLVKKLEKIKNKKTVKAILNARNNENQSLATIAVCNNFPNIRKLENLLQDKEPFMIVKAKDLAADGHYEKATTILNRVLEKRKEIFGPNNPFTLNVQKDIASFMYKQGKYHDALKMQKEIYQKYCNLFAKDHEYALNSKSTIGLTLHRLSKNEQALEIYEELFSKQKQLLGSDHNDTLETQLHMALVLDKLKRFDEALLHNKAVYKIRKIAESPKAIPAQNNIAMVLCNQKKFDEALEVYENVLVEKQLLFGFEHPETLRTSHNIATVLMQQEKYTDALKILHSILNIQKKNLGPIHPDTLNTLTNIAQVFFTQGKWVAAYKSFQEVLKLRTAAFGPQDPHVQMLSMQLKMIKTRFEHENTSEYELDSWIQKYIIVASNNGDLNSVKELLNEGSNVNEKDIEGRTPLHFAANNNDIILAEFLFKNGADPTCVTNKGNTPLHTAVLNGHKNVIDIIFNHSTDKAIKKFVNSVTFVGQNSPLHVAAQNGCIAIVLLLLQHGATYNLKNTKEKKPADVSSDGNVCNLLKLVEQLFDYAKVGSIEVVKKIKNVDKQKVLAIGNARNELNYTLSQVLVSNKHKDIASQLLDIFKTNS